MAKHNDKSDESLHPDQNPHPMTPESFTKALKQQLVQLDNELYKLVCCYHFYHSAMQALHSNDVEPPDVKWQYGLFVINEWLNDTGDNLLKCLAEISGWVEKNHIKTA